MYHYLTVNVKIPNVLNYLNQNTTKLIETNLPNAMLRHKKNRIVFKVSNCFLQ